MRAITSSSLIILGIGLLAGSAVGVLAQDGNSEVIRPEETTDLFCVRASEEVAADSLNDVVEAGQVTIAVVSNAECAPGSTLDSLTDAEHFGIYAMHIASTSDGLFALGEEFESLGSVAAAEDADALLANLAADVDARASVLAPMDRALVFVDDELAWMEDHPPRTCYAGSHASWAGWLDLAADVVRGLATAIRAEDAAMLTQAVANADAFGAGGAPADLMEHACL